MFKNRQSSLTTKSLKTAWKTVTSVFCVTLIALPAYSVEALKELESAQILGFSVPTEEGANLNDASSLKLYQRLNGELDAQLLEIDVDSEELINTFLNIAEFTTDLTLHDHLFALANDSNDFEYLAHFPTIQAPSSNQSLGYSILNNDLGLPLKASIRANNAQVSDFDFSSSQSEQSPPAIKHQYSVMMGYGLAGKVDLNIGFTALNDDARVIADTFYQGTWYAGLSGRF